MSGMSRQFIDKPHLEPIIKREVCVVSNGVTAPFATCKYLGVMFTSSRPAVKVHIGLRVVDHQVTPVVHCHAFGISGQSVPNFFMLFSRELIFPCIYVGAIKVGFTVNNPHRKSTHFNTIFCHPCFLVPEDPSDRLSGRIWCAIWFSSNLSSICVDRMFQVDTFVLTILPLLFSNVPRSVVGAVAIRLSMLRWEK